MNFDMLTMAALREEIRGRALGGRIQRIVAPAPDQLEFELYARGQTHYLLVHAGHQAPCVHFIRE